MKYIIFKIINLIIIFIILPLIILYLCLFFISFGFKSKLVRVNFSGNYTFSLINSDKDKFLTKYIFFYNFFKHIKFEYSLGYFLSLIDVYEFIDTNHKKKYIFSQKSLHQLDFLFSSDVINYSTYNNINNEINPLKIFFLNVYQYFYLIINSKVTTKLILSNDIYAISKLNPTKNIIFLDFEKIGKQERQKGLNTFITHHQLEDLVTIRKIFKNNKLMIRTNPLNDKTLQELNYFKNFSPYFFMLPNYQSYKDLNKFFNLINNKKINIFPLCENKNAIEDLENIDKLNFSLKYLLFGLNDLKISYGYKFLFESLSNGLIENSINTLKKLKSVNYGFGGIASVDTGLIDSRRILTEHFRLKSKFVILSRSFYENINSKSSNYDKLDELENFETYICLLNSEKLNTNKFITKGLIEHEIQKLHNI